MKIALLGYGKMGKTIERLALQEGHEIVYKSTSATTEGDLNWADVAIEFSTPEVAVKNLTLCFKNNIPVVCGTTGWLSKYEDINKLCKERNGSFIYASNFSVGVNLFFSINSYAAKLFSKWSEYDISIEEIHHTEKKDAPSGTAITIAQEIMEQTHKKGWTLSAPSKEDIKITALREADIKGTHTVSYQSNIDTVKLTHKAHTRDGFAKGAILAATWLQGKEGVFSMKDVLGL